MSNKTLAYVVSISALYVACQILADVASLRIVMVLGMIIDGGTLIYPLTFTLRDLVHKATGIVVSRVLVVIAVATNLFMALYFWLVATLPPDMSIGAQTEFTAVFSPVLRIVLASIVAELVAELLDGEGYRVWQKRFGERYQWGRVLFSNAISVPIDSVLFCVIAFAGLLPVESVVALIISNLVIKYCISVVSIPLIYFVPKQLHE